jgi:phage-related tail fiber protein
MAAAEVSGKPLILTHMAVGDGAGNEVSPNDEQTQLVRERFRTSVNRIYQDHENPLIFTAEIAIPADVGGFTLREIAIFDADGGMVAVGNLPPSYKPISQDGAYGDVVYRMDFLVSNAVVVKLVLDPNVAVATQAWIAHHVTMASLLPGGTTGQIPRKRSNAPGDIVWDDVVNVNVVVETLEETQDLVEGQTVIDLQVTTTKGLALYIAQQSYNGERLPKEPGPNGWQPDPEDVTRVILGRPYPGAKVICVQNEPLGSLDQPLAREQNLADVDDVPTARQNLDVYSKAEADASGQPGDIKYTVSPSAPAGWLKANGAAISRTAYAALFAVIGETYGKGDGFNTFNLPDLRGEFIRSWDDGRRVDPDRVLGSPQSSQNISHTHGASIGGDGEHSHRYMDTDTHFGPSGLSGGSHFIDRETSLETERAGYHSHSISIASSGGNEARPRNVALLACIKY